MSTRVRLVVTGYVHVFIDDAELSLCEKVKRAHGVSLAFGMRYVPGECYQCHCKDVELNRALHVLPPRSDEHLELAWPDQTNEPDIS